MKAGFGKYKYLLHKGGTFNGRDEASRCNCSINNIQEITETNREYEFAYFSQNYVRWCAEGMPT